MSISAGIPGAFSGATGIRLDPPLNYNFLIGMAETTGTDKQQIKSVAQSLIGDVLLGGFTDCSGLDMSLAEERLHEGGRNDTERRFPTRTTWTNLTFKRGVSRISQSGWDWLDGFGAGKVKRMDGVIILFDDRHLPHNLWTFTRAFPVKFTGPALNATGREVAVETLELAHEGLWQLSVLRGGAGLLGVDL
jgi:phage tail-like protein